MLCYARHNDVAYGMTGIYSLSLELTVVDLPFLQVVLQGVDLESAVDCDVSVFDVFDVP
jgi:hypothetical protein